MWEIIMIENNYYVYAHINKLNGKIYFGQTTNIKQRWSSNGRQYKRKTVKQTHFYNSIIKYRWNNFYHIIIEQNLSHEKADLLESYLIKTFDTQNTKLGYNLKSGGSHGKHTEETKRKISTIVKEKMTKDVITKLLKNRKSMKGENNPFYGKHHTEETRKHLKEVWKIRREKSKLL